MDARRRNMFEKITIPDYEKSIGWRIMWRNLE